jgi:hypothetical protein
MGDLVTVSRIASMLDALTSDGDLNAVVREVHKRASKLQAARAAGFKEGDSVYCRRTGKTIHGIVERVDGRNVIVKMEHGFVARIAPNELSLVISQAKRSSV